MNFNGIRRVVIISEIIRIYLIVNIIIKNHTFASAKKTEYKFAYSKNIDQ